MQAISFLINTSVDTRDHLELLLKSLKENLFWDHHEILVFIDSDNENVLDFLLSIKNSFKDLKIIKHDLKPCVGYARNNNLMVEFAKNEICSYLQSDMVICKNYDKIVLAELEENCVLSATRIEPPLHGKSDITITHDLGTDPTSFDLNSFINFSESVKSQKTISYFFAPFTFYKKVWLSVGGYDTIFRRSREDSDILIRLLKNKTKIKQTFAANVYHFTCVSSRGKKWFDTSNYEARCRTELQSQADYLEMRKFVRKWGSFAHGEKIPQKFDIDLILHENFIDSSEEFHEKIAEATYIEPYVSRVWLPGDIAREQCISHYDKENDPANALLNFSTDDWKKNKIYYNSTNYNEIFKKGQPIDFNIKLELKKSQKINPEILNCMHSSISGAQPGKYEFGPFILNIKKVINLTDGLTIANNPSMPLEHFNFY